MAPDDLYLQEKGAARRRRQPRMSTEGSRSQNRGKPEGGSQKLEGSQKREERQKREGRESKKDERRFDHPREGGGSKERRVPQLLTTPQERKRKISIGKRGSAVLKAFLPDILQKSPPSSPMLPPGQPPSPSCLSTPASQRSSPPLHHSPTPPSLSTTTASSPTTPPSLSTPPSLESLRSGLRSDCEGSSLSRIALTNSLSERQEDREVGQEPKLRGLTHSTSDTTCNLKSAR